MFTLKLNEMSIEDKLQAMEILWDDLSRLPENVPVPDWHERELASREEAHLAGEAEVEDWDAAKRHIKERLP